MEEETRKLTEDEKIEWDSWQSSLADENNYYEMK